MENIIINICEKLANKIENDKDKGQCLFIPYFLKYYLFKYHNIDITVHSGLIETDDIYTFHNWNSYQNKLIDISVHQQYEDLDSNCIILDEIYINKNKTPIYHLEIPDEYIDSIEKLKVLEKDSSESMEDRMIYRKLLNEYEDMLYFMSIDLSTIEKIEEYLKDKYSEKLESYLKYS